VEQQQQQQHCCAYVLAETPEVSWGMFVYLSLAPDILLPLYMC